MHPNNDEADEVLSEDLDLSILKLEAAIRPATSHNQQMVAAFMGSAAGQITYTMFE